MAPRLGIWCSILLSYGCTMILNYGEVQSGSIALFGGNDGNEQRHQRNTIFDH
jgi:hypothetical protein